MRHRYGETSFLYSAATITVNAEMAAARGGGGGRRTWRAAAHGGK